MWILGLKGLTETDPNDVKIHYHGNVKRGKKKILF